MKQSPEWYRDEEFRQKVIRQAMLLGFTAREIEPSPPVNHLTWKFTCNDREYGFYPSLYSAALEYLRLMQVPSRIIGVDIGQV